MPTQVRMHFDRELTGLKDAVLLLGIRARQGVAGGLRAYLENDVEAAGDVISADRAINELRYQIEQQCYTLLAIEQPVAGDMRAIVAALTFAAELERIGDHGKKIARICQRTATEPRPIPLAGIARMGELALAMVDGALAAMAARDAEAARTVSAKDDEVDALYKQTFNVTLSYMLEDAQSINAGTHLIQIAHELERVADRATNVAERVVYVVSGELVDLNA